jgi:hypothetical protein
LESTLADGKGGFLTTFFPGDGTTRFDMRTGEFQSVDMAPHQTFERGGKTQFRYFPWSSAITDGKTAYLTTRRWRSLYSATELFSFRPGDWPDIRVRRLGNIDPQGRVVFTRNLSLTPDGKHLVVVGKCMVGKFKTGRFDGVWVIDRATGESRLAADITEAVRKSFKDDTVALYGNQYSGDNVVGRDGWIYVGVRKMPECHYAHTPDVAADLRLMALRVAREPGA